MTKKGLSYVSKITANNALLFLFFYETFVALNLCTQPEKGPVMLHKNAKLKSVRPFKAFSALTPTDIEFESVQQKVWECQFIDLGCGAGLSSIQLANQNPNSLIVSIERTKEKFLAFENRLKTHSFNNIHAVNQDALYWLPKNIKNNSIDGYYILYPNPYPKESQANKRWHRTSLFEFLLSSLKDKGFIHFATNEAWLAEEACDYFQNYWSLCLDSTQEITSIDNFKPRTHFEKKYLLSGQTCFDMRFLKCNT